MAKFICTQCKQSFDAPSNFCGNCGGKIEEIKENTACSKCGATYENAPAFCSQCGTQMPAAAAAPAAESAAAPAADQAEAERKARNKGILGAIAAIAIIAVGYGASNYYDDIIEWAQRDRIIQSINASITETTGGAPESVTALGDYQYSVAIYDLEKKEEVKLTIVYSDGSIKIVKKDLEKWDALKKQYKFLQELTQKMNEELKKYDSSATVKSIGKWKFEVKYDNLSGTIVLDPEAGICKPESMKSDTDKKLADSLNIIFSDDDELIEGVDNDDELVEGDDKKPAEDNNHKTDQDKEDEYYDEYDATAARAARLVHDPDEKKDENYDAAAELM